MGMLVIVYDWGVFQDKKKTWNGAKCSQNPSGNPGSVCFPPNTGKVIHLSAGQYPKTQGQIDTGVAYQEDNECSSVAELHLKTYIFLKIYGKT